MKCMGYCEDGAEATHEDPKDPPLDTDKCLCRDCYICHLDEALEEAQEELDRLQKMKDEA